MRARWVESARVGAVVGAVACAAALLAQAPRTLRDGVFSAAQAQRGQRVFTSICVDCHEMTDFVGPGAYLDKHEGRTLWVMFDFVRSNMPDNDPSSLDPADYAAVIAYIFSAYGLPAGAADMPMDREALESIVITRPPPSGG
ncbi:MAG TPA: cytochrome c [Gammaproteobacteria bacterium]|jgi:mono/diheme cytochrome c family protein|nr:cytochrome c [Gammaproteobacteria bacterium]